MNIATRIEKFLIALALSLLVACTPSSAIIKGMNLLERENYSAYPLIKAAKNGDTNTIVKLLKTIKNPDEQMTDHGNTALKIAVHEKHYDIIKILLDHGANPENKARGINSIQISISTNDNKSFDLLINYINMNVDNAIKYASEVCNTANTNDENAAYFLSKLLNSGIDNKALVYPWDNLLFKSIRDFKFQAAAVLLKNGADPYALGEAGIDSLSLAKDVQAKLVKWVKIDQDKLLKFDNKKHSAWEKEYISFSLNNNLKRLNKLDHIIKSISTPNLSSNSDAASTGQVPHQAPGFLVSLQRAAIGSAG